MSFITRRLAAACLAAATLISPAAAQDLTDLTITAPAGAGGGWDSLARSLQDTMMKTGAVKNAQVMNVPGAGGTVGLAQFSQSAKGAKDQLLVGGLVMVGAIITNKSPVNLTNVTPMARLTSDPMVVVVPKDSPIQSLADLTAKINEDVGSTVWAGGSAGGADHILAGLITQAAGGDPAKVNYVAYSGGGEALAALLGGQVTAGISGYGEFQGQIESGDLRALAISYGEPVDGIAAQPLKAQGLDVVMENWRGVFAGPDIADADKAALAAAIEKTVKSPEWAEVLKARGWTDSYLPADEFKAFVDAENTRITEVLKSIGLAR